MARYRKKPVVIEAVQWWSNGDHPDDYAKPVGGFVHNGRDYEEFSPEYQREHRWEGQVVRYFRHPDVPGDKRCEHEHCGRTMHEHGWIDTLEGGHTVCPGDYIITGVKGERYPCKPDIFEATYEPVDGGHGSAAQPGAPFAPHQAALDAVYTERNRVVAGLARAVIAAGGLAGLTTDPDELDWPVVVIDLPGHGQVSWHVPAAEAAVLFGWLGPYHGEWDGHTTDEKYARLDAYTKLGGEA